MGRLNIPIGDDREIRRKLVKHAVDQTAAKIAAAAASIAGAPGGYGVESSVGSDRVRAHVWAESPEAITAEIKSAPLLQAASRVKP